ncbi:uncharacterized protein ATNIH1004_011183 [Aspergillus tanneri]|uniref:Uncharacterized protein n=1 Tax=Aspergillus tanneri TaxID=1220188 RepID=A0A5M9M5D5_9EURO|nr:uncharacterized protein ATNIH1004_011183 [Aspergillus tanneri]KAA8642242.1 hypothetical protein ATNIH1004_011183 [Aspergillus tanneri]
MPIHYTVQGQRSKKAARFIDCLCHDTSLKGQERTQWRFPEPSVLNLNGSFRHRKSLYFRATNGDDRETVADIVLLLSLGKPTLVQRSLGPGDCVAGSDGGEKVDQTNGFNGL